MLVATWECLPYFCTPVTGTTAAQWTLYSGLSLSWNEASMFCKSLGGHLPVLNSRLRFNGFDVTVTKWRKANLVTGYLDWTLLEKSQSGCRCLGGKVSGTPGSAGFVGS
ncbi:uncharacterized protein LOC112560409 [Pomacea canaliculata]|uniref:uncharacterized protein LOC112560409 n=1 Tax=Pomacea canaliculata TaxID=400727 RepID=UPI000D732EC1|nr:uncharacterized protein LOC112560409 [Pomacea canaliculata]